MRHISYLVKGSGAEKWRIRGIAVFDKASGGVNMFGEVGYKKRSNGRTNEFYKE